MEKQLCKLNCSYGKVSHTFKDLDLNTIEYFFYLLLQVVLDIQQFTPEEITVKVVDKFIVVEGKHEEKQDEHGWISRQFIRKYLVPEQCDLEQVKSTVSSDGILTITAPRKHDPQNQREKLIRIEMTGKPLAREILEAKKEEKKSEKK